MNVSRYVGGILFPSSFEANGGLTDGGESVTHSIFEFPSPLEVIEVSNYSSVE